MGGLANHAQMESQSSGRPLDLVFSATAHRSIARARNVNLRHSAISSMLPCRNVGAPGYLH